MQPAAIACAGLAGKGIFPKSVTQLKFKGKVIPNWLKEFLHTTNGLKDKWLKYFR